MTASNRLCDYCVQVPFEINTLRELGVETWKLGTAERIRGSNCPSCRIVSFVLYETARTELYNIPPSTEIDLSWNRISMPRGGCFTVNIAPELQVYFVGNSKIDYRTDQAFCLTPNLGQALDLGRVKRWLSECTSNHGGVCSAITYNIYSRRICENYVGLELLRFIDVQRECIVETRVACRYVALSYVWGLVTNVRLTTSNMADLMKPHALKDTVLPQTIKDAITFVRGVGEQYLWCDALCLLQNDPDDMSQGVNAMDLIYEQAFLTIVAACGHDANSGLPGVMEGTRFMPRYPEEIARGVQLDVYLGLDQAIKHSLYSSRAWTFQEEILSKRIVYFIDNKVYFRCRSTTLFEFFDPGLDSFKDQPMSTVASMMPTAVHMLDPVEDFKIMLLYYSKRALTYQQDALQAMAGIIRRLSDRMKCRFLEGLPTAAFDLFILFRKHKSLLHRREGFPSYSWAGWRGSLMVIDSDENEFLKQNTWIIWYKRSTRGITNLVWDPLANDSFPCNDLEYIGYRERRPFQCPITLSFPTNRTRPTDDIALAPRDQSYPVLQFWTLSVYFNIKITNRIGCMARILDKFGNTCGVLYLDGLEETTFFNAAGPFELITLSVIHSHPWTRFDKELRKIAEDSNLQGTDEFYNVMVLEWSEGVAERRGIGFVRQDSVTKSLLPGPAWKEILLG